MIRKTFNNSFYIFLLMETKNDKFFIWRVENMNQNYGNLILTRRIGQKLFIFTNKEEPEPTIMLEFNRLNGSQAVFRIEAPLSVAIWREEVYRRILEEGKNPKGPSNAQEDTYGNR